MASNCTFWKDAKCAGTNNDYHRYCSLDEPDYESCPLYTMIKVKSAGGTIEDMLTGADLIGGAKILGGSGRRLSDRDLEEVIKRNATTTKRKKWWEFWKRESIDEVLLNSVDKSKRPPIKRDFSGKVKKCINCGSELLSLPPCDKISQAVFKREH